MARCPPRRTGLGFEILEHRWLNQDAAVFGPPLSCLATTFPATPTQHSATMTRPAAGRYTPTMRYLIAGLAFGLAALAVHGAAATPGDNLYVQSETARVRQATRTDAPLVTVLEKGRKLKELRRTEA